LGILFNRTGHFNKTIKKQAEKAPKAMFEVLKRGRKHNLSIECHLELSNKMVKPILLYGSVCDSIVMCIIVHLSIPCQKPSRSQQRHKTVFLSYFLRSQKMKIM
jgi:prolipoprotein diacylglyceryltransferase